MHLPGVGYKSDAMRRQKGSSLPFFGSLVLRDHMKEGQSAVSVHLKRRCS